MYQLLCTVFLFVVVPQIRYGFIITFTTTYLSYAVSPTNGIECILQ